MMDYEIFKEVVKENFLSYMPGNYQNMEVRVSPVDKVNCKLDGLSLLSKNEKTMISPTLYINDMYEKYLKTEDLQATLQEVAEVMDTVFREAQLPPLDISTARDNIIFQLVNTLQNEDMLTDLPHRNFEDLSIIYRWVSRVDERGIESVVVHNDLARQLGMDEEELFNAASVNTRRILPPVVKSLDDVAREIFLVDTTPSEVVDIMSDEIPSERVMWVITNELGICGASSMLYENELHKLSVRLGTDLFVMPSSIHEIIAISAVDQNPSKLAEIVTEVNMGQVELENRLSNQVYYYDRDLRKLSIATDTPNKRLDGKDTKHDRTDEKEQSR